MNESVAAARMLMRLISRVALLVLAAAAIAGASFLWLGPPTLAREFHQNEVARFAPTIGHGIGQLAGESVVVVLVAYAGRRWLRIRL